MHAEVLQFLKETKEKYPEVFKNKKVLELGSLNINGTPREFFENCYYTGVDQIAGDGVDVVSRAHEFKSKIKFDVVISTEMLEHDKYADESIKNAWKLLKKGGYLIVTAANVNRPVHYQEVGEDNHYENIIRERVEKWAGELNNCEILTIEEDEQKQDIRFIFKKK
jgi:SAM-dependent methyltransferase